MRKRVRIASVVSALVLSLMAIPQASAKRTVEVAFMLDAPGSMGPLIEGAKIPPALREAPKPERNAVPEQQSTERKQLNAKLADLVAKRDAYIAEQRGKQRPKISSFDQAVAATLKAAIR